MTNRFFVQLEAGILTTIAAFIEQHPLLMLHTPGFDEFPGALFPLEDGFVTVGPTPGPGYWSTGKDAHVIRGPWRINEAAAELIVEDERGKFILTPPITRGDIAQAKAHKVTDPELLAERKRYAIFWFPELEGLI